MKAEKLSSAVLLCLLLRLVNKDPADFWIINGGAAKRKQPHTAGEEESILTNQNISHSII